MITYFYFRAVFFSDEMLNALEAQDCAEQTQDADYYEKISAQIKQRQIDEEKQEQEDREKEELAKKKRKELFEFEVMFAPTNCPNPSAKIRIVNYFATGRKYEAQTAAGRGARRGSDARSR